MARMKVRPREGLVIRRPVAPFDVLPEAGLEVEVTSFWRRRLDAGDVVEVKPAGPAARTARKREG